jgi:hypothetical protein
MPWPARLVSGRSTHPAHPHFHFPPPLPPTRQHQPARTDDLPSPARPLPQGGCTAQTQAPGIQSHERRGVARWNGVGRGAFRTRPIRRCDGDEVGAACGVWRFSLLIPLYPSLFLSHGRCGWAQTHIPDIDDADRGGGFCVSPIWCNLALPNRLILRATPLTLAASVKASRA